MVLNYSDIPLLRERGFQVGMSGHTWFGTDVAEEVWKVTETQEGDLLFAPSVRPYVFGRDKPMSREEFEWMFPKGRT